MPRRRKLPLPPLETTAADPPEFPALTAAELAELRAMRPRSWGDCLAGGINAARPCPWYGCRHHLGLDIDARSGRVDLHQDPEQIELARDTCSLDVADRGGATLEEVGELLRLTRERIRQVEAKVLRKIARRGGQALAALAADD